jgi:two-component system sensor histidine kinase UhpB
MLDVLDSSAIRSAQEAERRRIARELHDNAVQSLTALVADLEYFRTRRLSLDGESGQEVLAKVEMWQALAHETLLSMRRTLGGLRGCTDAGLDLEMAIRTLLQDMQRCGYSVIFECDDWPGTLPDEYSSNLYCIVREALTNIRKHAQASKISVFMFSHEGCLHVSVGDNGIGMALLPASASPGGGYHQGLIGLRERAAALGGRISIESEPGKGTRVDVEVPLPWGE